MTYKIRAIVVQSENCSVDEIDDILLFQPLSPRLHK